MSTTRTAMAGLAIIACGLLGLLWVSGGLASGCGCPWTEEQRDEWLQPDRVMNAVGVTAGMTVAEVGAGSGYFAVKLARRVGDTGRVWANDIDADALAELEQRAERDGLENIVTVLGDVTEPGLPEAELDMVFLVYTLHHLERPVELLGNLRRSLRPGATVVVLDQNPEVTGNHHFFTQEKACSLFTEAGYHLLRCEGFLERDLFCVFACDRDGESGG